MELDINGQSVAGPTADDVVRALGAGHRPPDWFITLDTGSGASLSAIAQADGRFIVAYADAKLRRRASADANAVQTAFVKFLAGDGSWENGLHWQVPQPSGSGARPKFVRDTRPLTGRDLKGDPPQWAIVVMVGVIGFVGLMFSWPDIAYAIFPFAHSDFFWVGLIVLPMVALVLLMAASKGFELRQAASWSNATGRIVSSAIAQRRHQFEGEPERIESYAAVAYEFTANGRTVRGSRIGIGDDNRGADAAPTVARYPVGAAVTVYYDPNNPTHCVLERGGPQGITRNGCIAALAELAVAGGILWWLIARAPGVVAARFPHANENFVVAAAGIGILMLMMFYAHWRTAKGAQSWPTIAGKVVRSEVESYEERVGDKGSLSRFYRPVVEYAYTVNGQDYRGNQIKLMATSAGNESWAAKAAARYPIGRDVTVSYEPENPGNAALEVSRSSAWWLLLLAAGAFALAAWQAGVLG
jgi:ABC-type multidrug transport system fused ATPase/permease subunit